MRNKKQWAAMALALVMGACTWMTGCGGSDSDAGSTATTASEESKELAAEDTESQSVSDDAQAEETVEVVHATYLLGRGVNSTFADEYEDLDQVKYWMDMVWDVGGTKKKVEFDFSVPPEGSGQENFNTLMATGEFQDVIDLSYSVSNISTLYEEGVIRDLTDYVAKYMPNYNAWLDAHSDLAPSMKVGGKILCIYPVGDAADDAWGGFVYRRDWLVKYGTNPETGVAFTGGWQDEEKTIWEDDVVFPSGGTDPIYISDWEWMIPILKTALEEEGITDGYAFQLYKGGVWSTDEFTTGFGESANVHLNREGKAVNGYVTDSTRAALECLNKWYENGWVNTNFEENSSDIIWWMVDTPAVYSGKVGMWFGLASQCGNVMADASNPTMADMCVYAAREPINDIYGDADCQGQEPNVFFGTTILNSGISVGISTNANEEDIPAILTALDYLYGEEGSFLRSFGFSGEQQAEVQSELYNEYGLEDGTYRIEEVNGTKKIILNEAYQSDEELRFAANIQRVAGLGIQNNVERGRTELQQHMVDEMGAYTTTGCLALSPAKQLLSADQSEEVSIINSNVDTYVAQAIPQFIRGELEIEDDADWEEFCQTITDLNQDLYVDYLNEALGF